MVRDSYYNGEVAYLATMHRKERAIAPSLARALGIRVQVTAGLNTDQFGTFGRDIARRGSQLESARAKISATFERSPHARLAIASEGSFEPHPHLPQVFLASEVIVFTDRHYDLEVIGRYVSTMTNYANAVVTRVSEALSFAQQAGFPGHGVIVSGCRDGQSAPRSGLLRDISSVAQLAHAVQRILNDNEAAFVEADMRAHRNPTRMKAIEAATRDLVRSHKCRCPVCARPGFEVTNNMPGSPRGKCGYTALGGETEILTCWGCGHCLERAAEKPSVAPIKCLPCHP